MADLNDHMADAIIALILLTQIGANATKRGTQQTLHAVAPGFADAPSDNYFRRYGEHNPAPKGDVFRLPAGTKTALDRKPPVRNDVQAAESARVAEENRRVSAQEDPFVDDFGS